MLKSFNRRNRPIVLLGSGLETGHPEQGPAFFIHFAMLKIVNLARLLSTSPEFSCRMFPQESFSSRLTVLGFFDWPMALLFFEKKLCNWRVNLSKGSVTVDRLAQPTICAVTVALEETVPTLP